MKIREIFFILSGWVCLIFTVIGAIGDASETMVMGGFIFTMQAFMMAELDEIKGKLDK